MNDYFYNVANVDELNTILKDFFATQQKSIRLLNIKIKERNEKYSKWLCDVSFKFHDHALDIFDEDDNKIITLNDQNWDALKLRPFYYAACIGNKNIVFEIKH